ncbi:hypothetical protein BH23ACT10_BH23ACT10_28310 [soil metagenome]
MTDHNGDGGRVANGEDALQLQLRDGTHVLVRAVNPDDKGELEEGFGRLSPRSRYLRFHQVVERLSDEQLRYLTDVDQVDHVAWVAIDLDDPEQHGIGVARFIRLDDEPTVAEAAVTVLDAYQGRGLGTDLLHVLAAAAVRRGVTTFRAYVLGENRAMLKVLDALGPTRTQRQLNVYQIDVDLPITEDAATTSATHAGSAPAASTDCAFCGTGIHSVFRAVTGKQLPEMHTTVPPVWLSDDTDGTGRQRFREWLDRLLAR